MFTPSADPCPALFNPVNGAIMCTGPQVTDESCNYTCQAGYNLTGSIMRTCQLDHTWSGHPTSCSPKQCVELVGQNHAFVVTPCGQDFNTACNVLCDDGYRINSTDGWRQTCQLNEELDVEWSDPPVCIGQYRDCILIIACTGFKIKLELLYMYTTNTKISIILFFSMYFIVKSHWKITLLLKI